MGAYGTVRARLGAQPATFHDQFMRALTRARAHATAEAGRLLLGNGGARRYPRAANRTALKLHCVVNDFRTSC